MPKKKPPVKSVVVLTPAQKRAAAEKAAFYANQRAMGFPVPGDVATTTPKRSTVPVKVVVDAVGRVVNPASATSLLTAKPGGTGKAAPTVVAKPKPAAAKPTPPKPKPVPAGVVSGPAPAASFAPSAPAANVAPTGGTAAYKPMSQSAMAAQAAKLVAQILGPQIQSTQAAYRDKGASANAAYAAAAQMQQPVAGQIDQTYAGASARDAVIAKGLAVGAQLAGGQTADASNAVLAQNNSPQQVKAADIGSVLGSLGGLSAQGLNREGAAFSAAARFLPTQSRNLGIDAVKAAGNEGAAAVGAINAKRPELVQGILGQLQDQSIKQQSLEQNNAVLAREGYIKETGFTPEGTMPFATRKYFTDAFGIDPISKLPTLEYQRAVTAQKQYAAKGKKGGFTAAQIRALKGDALVDARDAFDSQTTYQDAILTMLAGGYPLVIAQNALNRFWKQPGGIQAWEAPGKGRPKLSFQQRGGK